jgi:hypothetical protein
MINLQKLYIIWPPHKYSYKVSESFIRIEIKYKCILICNDMIFKYISTIYTSRKNCFLSKSKSNPNVYISIFFHENYIKSIIRSYYLNTLLND